MICSVATATSSNSYYETIQKVSGKYSFIPNTFYILLLCGNILIYHAFVLKNLIPMINTLFKLNYGEKSFQWTILGVILTLLTHFMILPFLFSKKLRIVKRVSSFCSFAMIFSVSIIILAYFKPSLFDLPEKSIDWQFVDYYKFDGVYVCSGYYLLSFTFQQIVIEVNNEVRPKTGFSGDLVIFANCMLSSLIYIVISFVGYLSVYSEPNINEMNNYITYLIVQLNNRNPWLFFTSFLVIVNVCFANIINYLPTIKFLNSLFKPKKIIGSMNKTKSRMEDYDTYEFDRESKQGGNDSMEMMRPSTIKDEQEDGKNTNKIKTNSSKTNLENEKKSAKLENIQKENKHEHGDFEKNKKTNQTELSHPKNNAIGDFENQGNCPSECSVDSASDVSVVNEDSDEIIELEKDKNRIIVLTLFFTVLFFSLVMVILDVKMDTIFNLVSAIGGPVVLLVIPSVFYMKLVHQGKIPWGGIGDYIVGTAVLCLGFSMWFISIFASIEIV